MLGEDRALINLVTYSIKMSSPVIMIFCCPWELPLTWEDTYDDPPLVDDGPAFVDVD